MSLLVVTGTGTGVGKTVATAALACAARLAGVDVAVCKPVQTGTDPADGPGDDDLREVGRLAGVTELHSGWRYPDPMGPVAAARRAGAALPDRDALVSAVRRADAPGRLTLVEGAGGLLVELGEDRVTLRDLAVELAAPVLVVTVAGLGTLNHTALTLEALATRNVACAGLVIGAWPAQPGMTEIDNRGELGRMAPVRAALPAGVGSVGPADFERISATAFDPGWIAGLL